MADLLDFKRGQFSDACMAGASVTKITELFGVARITVSKVMATFKKEEENLLTEPKLWKKAEAVWLGPLDSYAVCKDE